MANFCSQCGAALPQDARFCQSCGQAVPAAATPAAPVASATEAPVEPVAEPAPPAPTPTPAPAPFAAQPAEPEAPVTPPATGKRNMLLIGGGVLAVALAAGTWAGFSVIGTKGMRDDSPAELVAAEGEKQTLYAVGEANLRDKPSLDGSKVVGKLKRGEKVEGVIVPDGKDRQWLKIDGSERYVSLANLAKGEPPVLASTDGSDRVLSAQCAVLASASAGAEVKTTLKTGAAVKIVGSTPDGFIEYGLPGGGVGYAAESDGGCASDPSPAKGAVSNTLIQFNADDCEFGPELKPYFDKAIAKRDAGGGASEGQTITWPVDKVWRGLRVTSVLLGYEWHGVYFAAPASKVQAVFRDTGVKIDKDGGILVSDPNVPVSAGITATSGDDRKNGQTELTCGV